MNFAADSQSGIVLNHLIRYGEITSWEAIEEYHITRISAVIKILRDAGFDIDTEMMQGRNRNGRLTRWGVYRLGGFKK